MSLARIRVSVLEFIERTELRPYILALFANLCALGMTQLLPASDPNLTLLFFGAAVGITSWFGGFSSGTTTILLSLIFTPALIGWDQIDMSTIAGRSAYFSFIAFILSEFVIAGISASAKANRDALHESEERYRTLVQSAVQGIYRSERERRFLDVNRALQKTLGYGSREELLALNLETQLYAD